MNNMKGNVIKKDEFRVIMNETLDYLADSVASTFGPYGHNAIIETTNNVYTTKDGWHTLQNINFTDPTRNAIKTMIESVARSIVLSVGDGSTTSTIAANKLNKIVQTNLSDKYTIREIEDTFNKCVDAIESELLRNATPITEDNMYEAIKKISLVSTNWNEELSTLIADSYQETNNPIIKVMNSGTDKTYVEYIEGYDLAGELLLKEYYANDREHNRAAINNPVILLLNYNVQASTFTAFYCLSQIFRMIGRPLVILAPGFETTFVAKLSAVNQQCIKDKEPIATMFLYKLYNFYDIDASCIRDFAMLTGCVHISIDNTEFREFLDDVSSTMMKSTKGLSPEEEEAVQEEKHATTEAAIQYILTQFAGSCGQLFMDSDHMIAKELPNVDGDMIKEIRESIYNEINATLVEANSTKIITEDIRMKRIRLGKLNCKMAVIKVGGYGDANVKAKQDALDDATRACEAAYRDGYNMGGTLSITKAIDTILSEGEFTPVETDIYNSIKSAFMYVYYTLFANKYDKPIDELFEKGMLVPVNDSLDTELLIDNIIGRCVNNGYAFDIISNKFDTESTIINPVTVDIQALKSCMKLVTISITSNQFVHKHYDLNTDDITIKEV